MRPDANTGNTKNMLLSSSDEPQLAKAVDAVKWSRAPDARGLEKFADLTESYADATTQRRTFWTRPKRSGATFTSSPCSRMTDTIGSCAKFYE